MEDNEFWITIWKLIVIMLCVLITTVGGCTIHRDRMKANLSESGVSGSQIECLYNDEGDNAVCAIK